MRIQVKGYLGLRGVIGDRAFQVSDAGSITVRELLRQLALELGDEFAGMISEPESGGIGPHIAVLVNGRHCTHLPDGLDTELQEGDEVAIFPPVMGG